ncbi:MAG: response regulator [Desulfobacterales bacterium]|nr:response regulator [Desulfobacterales bacterium]
MSADIKEKLSQPSIRLLLVDDEKGYVDVLANRLGKRGIHVTKAYNGSQAIKALRGTDYDVSVLDLKMEDMDGLEVLRIYKKIVPEMPVIMLTGHGSQEAALEGMAVGAFDYLTKPCEFDELLDVIRDAYRMKSENKNV